MASLNKVMLIGNLGSDPEFRHTPNGQPVATFNIATTERWGGRDGSPAQEKTEWHRIVVWGRLAEICNQYLRKGRPVFIEGRLQTRSWQDAKTNATRYTTEVVAQAMQMLGSPRGEGEPSYSGGGAPGGSGGPSGGGGGGNRSRSQDVAMPDAVDIPDSAQAGADFFEDDSDLPF